MAVAATPALAVERPETVTAPLNVLAPAKVCVPVLTTPLKEASASGIFRLSVPEDLAKPMAALVVVMPSV